MNKHEFNGGARYVGGKIEKTVGDVVDSRDWKVDGIVDQVAGAGENLFGRAQSVLDDVADAVPSLVDDACERVQGASGRSLDASRRTALAAAETVRRTDERLIWAAAAAIGGYLVGWLVHRREA